MHLIKEAWLLTGVKARGDDEGVGMWRMAVGAGTGTLSEVCLMMLEKVKGTGEDVVDLDGSDVGDEDDDSL